MERVLRTLVKHLLVVAVALWAVPAWSSAWTTTRDHAMGLRERGAAAQAYAMLSRSPVRTNEEQTDREFVAGFLALRVLGRADLATTHFQNMAVSTAYLKGVDQPEARAMAGYWLGRALQSAGRLDDARQLYLTAAAYPTTFYGLLAASQVGASDTPGTVAGMAATYPNPELFWHDPRVRKELVLAIIKNESQFKPTARSTAGAMGAMQLMGGTVNRVAKAVGVQLDHRMVATNFDYNVVVGSKFFADLLTRYGGNVLLSAAAYNAGEGRADEWMARFGDPRNGAVDAVDWIELIPFKETRGYVRKVIATYITYMNLGSRQATAAPSAR